jgi:hypothetical protein
VGTGVAGIACLLAALAVVAFAVPASAAHPRRWIVSGSITGTYSNDVTWVQCFDTGDSGSAREHLTLNAKITPGQPAVFSPGGLALLMKMKAGGSWSVTGSYPPRVENPDETVTCGQQRPIQCGGKIRRNGPAAATLIMRAHGSRFTGAFLNKPSFSEDAANSPCLVNTEALLGLQEGLMEEDVFRENSLEHKLLTAPRSGFIRGRPFTVTVSAGPDGGCHMFHYSHCSESGGLKMTLHFAPR